jgi:hypothetical protein
VTTELITRTDKRQENHGNIESQWLDALRYIYIECNVGWKVESHTQCHDQSIVCENARVDRGISAPEISDDVKSTSTNATSSYSLVDQSSVRGMKRNKNCQSCDTSAHLYKVNWRLSLIPIWTISRERGGSWNSYSR